MNRTRSNAPLDVHHHLDRPVHGRPRQPRRDDRPPGHQGRPRGLARRPPVDGQRLHADLRGPAHHRAPRSATGSAASASSSSGWRIFIGGSALAALAPTTEILILARAIQGVGGAIVTPLTLTILSAAMPPERRAVALGAWGGIAGLAIAIGPLVGGAIAEGLDWHWIFWLNVPIGLVVIPLAAFRLTESYGPESRLDVPGLGPHQRRPAGARVGRHQRQRPRLGQHARSSRRSSPAPRCSSAFVVWEARQAHPMLPMSFFRNRAFSAANAVSLLMYFGMFGSIFLLSQFFQVVQGYSPFQAGLRTLPWTGMPIIVAPIAGILADRIGGRPILATGMALQAVALGWLAAIVTPTVAYEAMVVPFILAGIGMGLFFAPIANVVLSAVRPDQEGKASGATNTIREVGGVFGVAVLAAIFSANGDYGTPAAYVAGLQPAIAVGAVVVGLGAIAALFIPARAGARAIVGEARRGEHRREPGAGRTRLGIHHGDGRVRGSIGRVPCLHVVRRQSRSGRGWHGPPRAPTGRGRGRRGRARRGPRSCWSTGSANTPAATSTSATGWPPPASTSTPTTTAETAVRAAGAATSTAGRSTTTTWPSGSRPSGRRPGPTRRPVRPLDGRPRRPWLPPDRPPEARSRGPLVAGPRFDAASWKKTLAPALSRSSRRWPSRTVSTARPCRATRPWLSRSGADPLSAKASTTRFAAEALTEQARVRREYAGLTLPTLVLHGLDDGLVPAQASEILGTAPQRRAADLPGSPPRAPQRTGRPGDRRRDHRTGSGPERRRRATIPA